jgi:hypothetical protein
MPKPQRPWTQWASILDSLIYMDKQQTTLVFYEGSDDHAVLKGLPIGGLLASNVQLVERDPQQHFGRDGIVTQLSSVIDPAGTAGRAIALIDLDDQTLEKNAEWFEKKLRKEMPQITITRVAPPQPSPRVVLFRASGSGREGRVALVSVGLPEDSDLQSIHGLTRFAIDDYALRLIRARTVYDSMKDFIKEVSYDVAMEKLRMVADLLRQNAISVETGKRYLHILRGVVGYKPSTATMFESLMRAGQEQLGTDGIRKVLSHLVDDLAAAVTALR